MAALDSYDTMSINSDDEERPLMSLFMKLIDNKQSMVLTNAQILNILKIEFQMELSYIHELEKDIYLQCMKKFLNDWPRWDEFDEIASTMRTQTKYSRGEIETILQ
ncbi:hypothetical protein ACJJTC_010023 [Scirpophaga incertulas]